eukprot:18522-Pelagococcus_subviridis.AAC.7
MRTSISSAWVTFCLVGVFVSSPTNPTPHASLSFSGLNRPCGFRRGRVGGRVNVRMRSIAGEHEAREGDERSGSSYE